MNKDCLSCKKYKSGRCPVNLNGVGIYHSCIYYSKKRTFKDKFNSFFSAFKGVLCSSIIILICITIILLDFFWTKSSLEDIAGKKVSTSTVIWNMLHRSNK